MLELLKSNRPFGRLLVSSLISELGSHFTYMLLIVMSYEATGSMMTTMGIAMSGSIASLVMGSVAGVWVERWRPVSVMVISDLTLAVIIGALFWLPVNMWVYYGAAFATAVVRSFQTPATRKFQLAVVKEDDMLHANAALQATRESLKIIGPILAVAVLGLLPANLKAAGYLVDAVSYVLCAMLLFGLRSPKEEVRNEEAKQSAGKKPSFRQQWVEGFQPFKHPVIAASVIMFLCIIIGIAGADVIFTAHVATSGHSSLDVGYVFAALSAGLILASVAGTSYFSKWPLALRLGGATVLIGVFEALIGVFQGLIGMAIAAFVLGLFNSVYNISASTYMQLTVPREQIGRFFGLVSSLFSAVSLIGLAINGLLGTFLTPQAVLLWTGGIIAVVGLISLFVIAAAERKHAAQQVAEEDSSITT